MRAFSHLHTEVFIDRTNLNHFLSRNGLVSILYGDSELEGVQLAMAQAARGMLQQHEEALQILFGNLEEYYSPY